MRAVDRRVPVRGLRRDLLALLAILVAGPAFVVGAGAASFPQTPKLDSAPGAPTEADSAAPPFRRKRPRVSGYFQAHYRVARSTGEDGLVDNSDFRVQRVRIALEGDIYPWLGYDVEVDPRAPEITGVLRDAYATFRLIPRHRIRVGQQKTQFGYENRESSTRLFVVNRAELSDALSRGPNLRDVGLGVLGDVKLPGPFRLEDALTVVNGAGLNVQADDTPGKSVWGRLGLRFKDHAERPVVARLGVSAGRGDHMDPGDDLLDPADDFHLTYRPVGVDLQVDHRLFFLAAEYVTGRNRDLTSDESDEPQGYYVLVVGRLTEQYGPLLRLDDFDDTFHRWTLGGFYGAPDEPVRFLLNYERRTLKDGARGDDKLYAWLQFRY